MGVRPWVVNGGLALAALVIALGLAEVALRIALPASGGEGEVAGYFQHDTLLGWSKRPGAQATIRAAEYTVDLRINQYGLRGPGYAPEPAPDTRRVLLLGDSFVEGYTVGDDETVARVLETLLARETAQPVQVINAGTAGYSTDQEFLYFVRDGWRYDPDVVVLFLYVNDVAFNVRGDYWRGHKPYFALTDTGLTLRGVPVPVRDSLENPFEVTGGRGVVGLVRRADAWLGLRSSLYGLVRTAIRDSPLLSGITIRMGFGAVPGEFLPWKIEPDPDLARAWAVTRGILAALHAEVERRGSRLVVFWIPARPAVYPEDWDRTSRKYAMDEGWSPEQDGAVLDGICRELALTCIVDAETFRRIARARPTGETPLYFPRDGHWTREGHRVAAELLAATVTARADTTAAPGGR